MRRVRLCLGVAVLLSACCAWAAAEEKTLDLRRGVPADAFLAVYGKHNPERDFQKQYYDEVWKTVQETKIVERATKIVTSRLPEKDLKQAEAVLAELKEAAAPIQLEAIANAKEVVYAQVMQGFTGNKNQPLTSQHLVILRLTPEAAAKTQEGIKNLFGLAEKYSEGKLPVQTAEQGGAVIVSLSVPKEIPFRPAVARLQDVLIVSSSEDLAKKSLGMLTGGEGKSKFDDPRLADALSRLPQPEDSVAFFDGKQLMAQLRTMSSFVRQVGRDDKGAQRAAEFMDLVFDELAVFDYEVTVEYTEGNLNRREVYGKLLPGAENKLLGKVAGSGKPFEDWQSWVPADATSYSLTTGVNLHPIYERVVTLIREKIPEAQPGLKAFEEEQAKLGVDLDKDLLQAFSGECVSVTLPAATLSPFGGGETVVAMRCQKPERVSELLHRLVDWAKEQPPVKAQQLQLVKTADLEGFEELSAIVLTTFGVKPVIGFRDGWMVVGSNAQAVKKVFEVRAGKSPNIAGTKAFEQFKLTVKGPVNTIAYTNLAESTRRAANMLSQAGMFIPMALGMADVKGNAEEMKPVQEVLALLPSLGKIVAKFDFLEAQLGVVQAGDEPGSYRRHSVTVVRPAPAK
ncbi:MAG: hypothetical protein ACYC35_24680 [Pirellulales bacterium]